MAEILSDKVFTVAFYKPVNWLVLMVDFFPPSMKVPTVTTESGLQYKDIKVGEGPSPPIGFQVCKFPWLCHIHNITDS